MKIEHISVSRHDCYQECDAKYRFRYHLQVVSDLPVQPYFTFGKIVHRAIEEFTRADGKRNINEIVDEITSGKMELERGQVAPPMPPEYRVKLPLHLNNFLRLNKKIGNTGEVEWKFHKDLDPPNGRHCTGFIDRILYKGDNVYLFDYKTSKVNSWRKNNDTIKKDLQLQCYCWVVMTELKIPAEKITASLYYLEDAKLVSVKFNEQTLLEVPKKLLNVYKEIEQTHPDSVRGHVGHWCNRCDYRSVCPWFKAKK